MSTVLATARIPGKAHSLVVRVGPDTRRNGRKTLCVDLVSRRKRLLRVVTTHTTDTRAGRYPEAALRHAWATIAFRDERVWISYELEPSDRHSPTFFLDMSDVYPTLRRDAAMLPPLPERLDDFPAPPPANRVARRHWKGDSGTAEIFVRDNVLMVGWDNPDFDMYSASTFPAPTNQTATDFIAGGPPTDFRWWFGTATELVLADMLCELGVRTTPAWLAGLQGELRRESENT